MQPYLHCPPLILSQTLRMKHPLDHPPCHWPHGHHTLLGQLLCVISQWQEARLDLLYLHLLQYYPRHHQVLLLQSVLRLFQLSALFNIPINAHPTQILACCRKMIMSHFAYKMNNHEILAILLPGQINLLASGRTHKMSFALASLLDQSTSHMLQSGNTTIPLMILTLR